MGKLGDILKKDVGSLANKVLKADVGHLVKGAGRMLNTDVSTIAKGAGNVLTYDLGELFTGDVTPAGQPASPSPQAGVAPSANLTAAPAVAATDSSTPAEKSATAATPAANANPAQRAKLTDALVTRRTRAMPDGSKLSTLMPTKVGTFSRMVNATEGEIASDPVSATYSNDIEAVTITLVSCWDAEEAKGQMQRRQGALENARSTPDNAWVAGIDSHGVIFIWTREQYCFEVVSPRGVSALARFLADFPY